MNEELKNLLIVQAREQYGHDITPCGNKKSFDECFTEYSGVLQFWFNRGKNTHMVSAALPGQTALSGKKKFFGVLASRILAEFGSDSVDLSFGDVKISIARMQ